MKTIYNGFEKNTENIMMSIDEADYHLSKETF